MLIGLSGKAGAGKDTLANFLVDELGFKRYAFADAVRDVALAINPIVDDVNRLSGIVTMFGWDYTKRNYPEARRLLQVIGTEAGRQVLGENCWVDIVNAKWETDNFADAVITDLRFPNEESFIRDNGGWIVQITRPDNPDAIPTTHASEQFTPTPDFVVDNNGTLTQLHDKTLYMFNYFTMDDASWQEEVRDASS